MIFIEVDVTSVIESILGPRDGSEMRNEEIKCLLNEQALTTGDSNVSALLNSRDEIGRYSH